MDRVPSHPQTTKSPTRAAIGGISLLMVVAFAVQASAGLMSPAVQARHHAGLPTVRMIAEAVTRRVERQVRRQNERPAMCRVFVAASSRLTVSDRVDRSLPSPSPRRLSVLLTNLPPPCDAIV
jgi:hypothetical protein